ncbi:hypothetical protein BVY01_03570 [bacterium I07]|nr:hypothetical protein BVY01_03570 [bacterium I07]
MNMSKSGHLPADSTNLIVASLGFSGVYWILESVRDVVTFERGGLLQCLFQVDWQTLYMRILVVLFLILFGAIAESIKKSMLERNSEEQAKREETAVFRYGMGMIVLYWMVESFKAGIMESESDILASVFAPSAMTLWVRALPVFTFLFFVIYAYSLMSQHRRAEESFKENLRDLEHKVRERTTELLNSKLKLESEIIERKKVEAELREARDQLETRVQERTAELSDANQSLKGEISERIAAEKAQKHAQAALRESEKKYRTVFENSGAGIVILDQNNGIVLVNSEFVKISGFSRKSLEGKKQWLELVASDDRARIEKRLLPATKDSGRTQSRFEFRLIDKNRNVKHIFANLAQMSKSRWVLSMVDISDRILAQHEKEIVQEQLVQAQKMEGIGILAGGIAHDFNNLLTAIRGCTEMIMMSAKPDDYFYRDLEEIQSTTERAADLTRQLLLFSREHKIELLPINLNESVNGFLKMLQRLIGEDITIETLLDPGIWQIMGDRGTLEQMIMNLSVNARDAMSEGGKLTIQTENIVLDKAISQRMTDVKPGQYIRLSISDTGHGIKRDLIEHIFEPFFSTKESDKGTGLGLSVVYGIVQKHNGTIHVSSEPGKGTRFSVYIPAIFIKADSNAGCIKPDLKLGEGERLLIVEDDDSVRDFTVRALYKSGYEVYGVSNATESEQVFDDQGGNFDMVFSDVVLPDGTGIELVEKLLDKKPELRVLLSSGYTDQKSQWATIKEKGFPFIEKPYSLCDLLLALQKENA